MSSIKAQFSEVYSTVCVLWLIVKLLTHFATFS